MENVIRCIRENPFKTRNDTVKRIQSQFGLCYIREGTNRLNFVFSIREKEKEVFIWGVMSDDKYEKIKNE
jgi:hypothetical protein